MIQWYPGHMHKASKEFRKILPQVDLVIEVLDARLPGSSENPMLAKLRRDKPCVKLLNKADLADPDLLGAWVTKLESENLVKTLICSNQDNAVCELPALCRGLIPARANRSRMIYAMIAGIPNVGKSTLINRLAGRTIAKTGNEAALTRMQQRIEISDELTLIDTVVRNNLAWNFYVARDYDAARALHEENLALRRALGLKTQLTQTLHNLAAVLLKQALYTLAYEALREGPMIAEQLNKVMSMVASLD